MKKNSIIFGLIMLASGCAFAPHNANIAIEQAPSIAKIEDQGSALYLQVVDERDETDLGRRGAGIAAAKITADGIYKEFSNAVKSGFQAKGYSLVSNKSDASAELLVGLRTLKFEESTGFLTVGAEADATIIADAERGNEDYRKQYRVSDEDRQIAVSFGEGIDAQLSQVLNKALNKLFHDHELDEFLTK